MFGLGILFFVLVLVEPFFGPAVSISSNLQRSFYDYTADYDYNYDYNYETNEIFKKKRRKSKAPQDYDYNYDYDYDYDYATEDDYCFHCGADVTILPRITFKINLKPLSLLLSQNSQSMLFSFLLTKLMI